MKQLGLLARDVCLWLVCCAPILVAQSAGKQLNLGQIEIPARQSVGESGDHSARTSQVSTRSSDFIENKGQWDAKVKFLLRSSDMNVWITQDGAVYDMYKVTYKDQSAASGRSERQVGEASADLGISPSSMPEVEKTVHHPIVMKFEGASDQAQAVGTGLRSGVHNYFLGNDAKHWATNVPLFEGVRLESVYPGVDAVFYVDQGRPRYDLHVKPGAKPEVIQLKFEGAESIRVNADGSLALRNSLGVLEQRSLVAYQLDGGQRRNIECRFEAQANGRVIVRTGNYDATKNLIIDPIVYSTYFGGVAADQAYGVAIDAANNTYITGITIAPFPVLNAYQSSSGGGNDAFVSKFNANGSSLVFSTYIGGSGFDQATGIALDANADICVCGNTTSANFPQQNAAQTVIGGSQDAFVLRLHSSGSALLVSTFLGASGVESAYGIAVGPSNRLYVVGSTSSTSFPVLAPFQATNGGSLDAFVTAYNSNGTYFYSTYVGGSIDEEARSCAVDAAGYLYACGTTTSTNFPLVNSIQAALSAGQDCFLFKVLPSGSGLSLSTYYGGTGVEITSSIDIDQSANAYFTGLTTSSNFPLVNAFRSSYPGTVDGFLVKVNTNSASVVYSTRMGSSLGSTQLQSVKVNASQQPTVVGSISASGLPLVNAVQNVPAGAQDVVVMTMNASGTALTLSTYLGGLSTDIARAVTVDNAGGVYVAGITNSTNFPVLNAYQSTRAGNNDVFLAKILNSTLNVSCAGARAVSGPALSSISSPAYSTGNASTTYSVFSSAPNNGSATTNCGVASVSYKDVSSGTCPVVVTRTWTITDGCGATQSCAQTIVFTDNTAPVVGCPAVTTVLDNIASVPAPYPNLSAFLSAGGTVNDAGPGAQSLILLSETSSGSSTCTSTFSVTRVYRVSDACNNATTCTQVFQGASDGPPAR